MDNIQVALMGTPYVKKNDEVVHFRYKKAEALFFYLCVKKIVTRDELIRIFWGDGDEKAARDRLRDMLYSIKKVLGDKILLTVGNSIIKLDPHSRLTVDVDSLAKETIVEQYTGDFLDCFFIKNCLEFEDWVDEIRKQYKDFYIAALKNGLQDQIVLRNLNEVQRYVSLIIQNDPYNEQLCRNMMEVYSSLGQYNHAAELYNHLCAILKSDLDEKPEHATTALYEQLLELRERKSHADHGRTEYFFGRGGEIYQAMTQLEKLRAGTGAGGSVLLVGEAGVGKSALLGELQRRLDRAYYIILQRSCYQAEQELHLTPWYDILMQISAYVEQDAGENTGTHDQIMNLLFPCLGEASRGAQMDDAWLALTTEAVLSALTAGLGGKKVILIFDDIQWMDRASRRLLSSLMLKQGEKNVGLLTACRDYCEEDLFELFLPMEREEILMKMTVKRFNREETGEIVSERIPELRGKEEIQRQIYQDTEGNALFLVEMLQLINEKGYLHQLPNKVTNIIKGRLLDLTDREREALNAISLFFDKASLKYLQLCCAVSELELCDQLESLIKRRLIREDATASTVYYRFTHQKIRDYVHDSLSAGKRKLLHRRIAEELERNYLENFHFHLCSQMIYHFNQSGDHYKTYTYKIEYLMEFYSVYHETYPYLAHDFEDISSLSSEMPDSGGLLALAEEIRILGTDIAGADALKMKTEFILGRYYIRLGDYENGLASIARSIALAKQLGDDPCLLSNYKQMIYYGIQVHDMRIMETYLEYAMQSLDRLPKKEDERCLLIRLKGLFLLKTGRYAEAVVIIQQAITLARACHMPASSQQIFLSVCYNYIGECHFFQKNFEEAYRYFHLAIETCEKRQSTSGIGVFYTYAGEALYAMGRYTEARTYITSALESFDRLHALWGKASAEAYAALLEMKIGTSKKAAEHYNTARQFAKQLGNPPVIDLVDYVGKELMKTYKTN